MDILYEFLIDLILEGAMEGSKSNRIPKPIRIILITFLLLFYAAIIGIIMFVGVEAIIYDNNILGGIIIIAVGLLILISCIVKFRQIYLEKKGSR